MMNIVKKLKNTILVLLLKRSKDYFLIIMIHLIHMLMILLNKEERLLILLCLNLNICLNQKGMKLNKDILIKFQKKCH